MFLIHVLVGGVMILDKSLQNKKKKKNGAQGHTK